MPSRPAPTARSSSRSSKSADAAPPVLPDAPPDPTAVEVGEVGSPHGLRGQLRLWVHQAGAPSLAPGRSVLLERFGGPLATGPSRIAREKGLLEVAVHNLRDYATDKHLVVDDVPYGGGQGMVMKPDPLGAAIEHASAADRPRRILLSARGV